MLNNCLSLKDDRVFYGVEELFAGADFVNFFALNFMSALIYNGDDYRSIYNEALKFADTCYPQSYVFLLVAALNKPILRISDVCVLWRSPAQSRRYDDWQTSENNIINSISGSCLKICLLIT